jgi:hypothetical protein
MRPLCPGCKRPAALLGQWMAGSRVYLCRACTLAYPAPDVLERHDGKRHGVVVRRDAPLAARERKVSLENSLTRLQRGCVLSLADWTLARGLPCERIDHHPYLNCPVCTRELRTYTRRVTAGEPDGLAPPAIGRQLRLPVCQRCGQPHDRRGPFDAGEVQPYCQRCDDEISVLALWRNRGIFGDDDAEHIMDRVQVAFPGLFERGVLPDLWFHLLVEAAATSHHPHSPS